MVRLGEGGENGFDRLEVGQLFGGWGLLAVLDYPGFIDHESGSGGNTSEADEVGEKDAVGRGGGFVEIAGEGDGNPFLFSPSFLGEGAIDADRDHLGAEIAVSA